RMIGVGLVHRVQVLTLDVLDQGELRHLALADIAHHRGNSLETSQTSRAQAPLASHELIVAAGAAPHQDGLEDASRLDRRRELLNRLIVKPRARLERVGSDVVHRKLTDSGWCAVEDGGCRRNQGFETSAEGLSMHSSEPPGRWESAGPTSSV